MIIRYRQYPHPVLSYFSDDLVGCAFQTTFRILNTKNSYIFEAKAKTSSKDLVDLIDNERACYALHIECASTRFRNIYTSNTEEFSFEIDANELDGRVQVCSFILATEDLDNYKNKNFHPDYGDITFKVRKGDVLAVDRDQSFSAEKEIDPLKKIPSIFTVCVNNAPDASPYDIDINSNKVVIKLSQENFTKYKLLSINQNLQSTLASLILLPALVSLLETLKLDRGQFDEYEEMRWFRVIENRLNAIGIDLNNPNTFSDSSVAIAQKLIGDPITSSLTALEGYESEE